MSDHENASTNESTSDPASLAESSRVATPRLIALAILPLLLLGGLVAALFATGGGLRPSGAPPIEELTIDRITLPAAGQIELRVTNGGPSPVTVAQVLVDEAYWQFEIDPAPTIPRLGSAVIRVPYPWVETEPHELRLLTSTGVTFDATVDVSLAQPDRDFGTFLRFLLLGFYVGVIPVGLGMLWYPVVKRMGSKALVFVMSLTAGLLVFLLFDTLLEALEIAERLPEGFHPVPLVWLIAIVTVGLIEAIGAIGGRGAGEEHSPLRLAALIAFGIGLHNFGEGLAIGSAYTLGAISLGAFLVIGFTLHNVTEGLAIAAPLVKGSPRLVDFVWLTALAGAPAMIGTWVGAYAYSNLAAAIFLAIGAGAIAQVVYQVGRFTLNTTRRDGRPALTRMAVGGFVAGVVVMYVTALFVAA